MCKYCLKFLSAPFILPQPTVHWSVNLLASTAPGEDTNEATKSAQKRRLNASRKGIRIYQLKKPYNTTKTSAQRPHLDKQSRVYRETKHTWTPRRSTDFCQHLPSVQLLCLSLSFLLFLFGEAFRQLHLLSNGSGLIAQIRDSFTEVLGTWRVRSFHGFPPLRGGSVTGGFFGAISTDRCGDGGGGRFRLRRRAHSGRLTNKGSTQQ